MVGNMYDYSKYSKRTASEPVDDEDYGEVQVSEYVVFMFALDTYLRYLDEVGVGLDKVATRGLQVIKALDMLHLEQITSFLDGNLSTPTQKKMLAKAMILRPTPEGISRRALQVRTVLSRGGAATMRAVFEKNKALQNVRAAISASMVDDADAALDKFDVIQVRNSKIRDWIDLAAKTAGSGKTPEPVAAATMGGISDDTTSLLTSKMEGESSNLTSQDYSTKGAEGNAILQRVQDDATATAKKAIESKNEVDAPPTRSEVVGIATATAVAALSDPSRIENVPEPLRDLDPEQRAAALTDGKTFVGAGAGSGKSLTVVARVSYLIKNKNVKPYQVFVTSFNKAAALELKSRITAAVGEDAAKQVTIGTMNGLFQALTMEFGSPEHKNRLNNKVDSHVITNAIGKLWEQVYGEKPPPTKKAGAFRSKWVGSNIPPSQAKAEASSKEEAEAALYYEWYEGFKGNIPGWAPPGKVRPKAWEGFMASVRPGGRVLADLDDQITFWYLTLKDNPGVRKKVAERFAHLIVDESQDLNKMNFEIVQMMSEPTKKDSKDRSTWMVGDKNQSIYAFRGANVDQFEALETDEGWNSRSIGTNYRCQPEIVEAASKLISNNPNQNGTIKVDPKKLRGEASIQVQVGEDEASVAIEVTNDIKSRTREGSESVSDFAILARTNNELHAFETSCIIRGIPYARRGRSSFLGSPETSAVLGYVQLATGTDFNLMQKALKSIFDNPKRFFLRNGEDVLIEEALQKYAFQSDRELKSVNPIEALNNPKFAEMLANSLVKKGSSDWQIRSTRDSILDLGEQLSRLRANCSEEGYQTKDLFDDILSLEGVQLVTDPNTGKTSRKAVSFRDTLSTKVKDEADAEAGTDDEESNSGTGLGNVSFL